MNSRRDPGVPISGWPQLCPRKSQISASARNRAICGPPREIGATLKRGPPRVGALGQLPDPVFAGTPLRSTRRTRRDTRRRTLIGPPTCIPEEVPKSRFPGQARHVSVIADFRVSSESGDLRGGRLSNAGPRRSAQLVNFRTPVLPETLSATRDGDVGMRAAGI